MSEIINEALREALSEDTKDLSEGAEDLSEETEDLSAFDEKADEPLISYDQSVRHGDNSTACGKLT